MEITEEDKKLLTNTVDFISFSYYNSKTVAADPSKYEHVKGNVFRGYHNPYLEYTEWGWSIFG